MATDVADPEHEQSEPPERPPSRRPPRWLLGAALALIGAGAILVSTAYDGERTATRLGADLAIDPGASKPLDISANNSPTLVRSPVDGSRLVVSARIDTPRYGCSLNVSSDAGSSWSQTPVALPAGESKCYAPDVAFAADGTLYMTYVTLRGAANVPDAAWIVRSADGGRSLSAPERILSGLVFQVRVATDPARPARVYVTWLQAFDVGLYRFGQTGNAIRAIHSDDGGRTWTPRARVSSPLRERTLAPVPAVGPGGIVYVLYLDLGDDKLDYEGGHQGRGGPPYDGRYSLVLARSRDAGATWQESVVDARVMPIDRFVAFVPRLPTLAVDQASGRVYAAYEDRRNGDADVMEWSLGPGEARWNGPVRVNDTPLHDGREQYLPRLSVAPGGRLDVVYYDRRDDPRNRRNAVSLQSSFDGGKTFDARVALTDRTFDSRIGFGSERGLADLGSRLASLSTRDRTLAVWTDTRNGVPASGKQDLMRAIAVISDPARLSALERGALRWGGLVLALAGLALVGGAARARRRDH